MHSGSDSITKVDYFRVNGSPLTAPTFNAPFVADSYY
jgi:hypothetical protein